MNLANLIKRCYYDIQGYNDYISNMPYEFRAAIEKSPLNTSIRYQWILSEILPLDIWKELSWINWEFPNADYDSIDDFIIKNNLEGK